jgi:hypothetical protein
MRRFRAAAAAANKMKRRSIGNTQADEQMDGKSLLVSWYAKGRSHEQELRTVSFRIFNEHSCPDLRWMLFVPFERF